MSTTIDQRIVEMRFDNKQFEANVKTSLSTLEKLKQKLNFNGASKGLDTLNNHVKKVDFSPMENSAGKVAVAISHKWATLQHQIDRTVDSMVDSAKKAVSALTIDPIKTGLSEYETQINAVQTIMANTSHQGTTLNDVNQALDTLNKYADKTIYNFTEMTRNIGTFTAAGVDLQTSVDSIQGIANLAAVSGSTSQQASTAMYQLSQALAAGKVSLMDWNSVVNAGMGGKIFQDSLVRTSELLQTGAQDAIDTYGSFRESLTKGEWLTTEVLTETLKQLSGAYSEADLIAQGFTEEQAKEITELANTASEAATKVKTFTQLWDTLKEAAQSGWTQTWELIIGDFEEAKELWTGVSDVIGNFINKMSDARNNLLAGALNSPWENLVDNLGKAGVSVDEFEEKVTSIAKDNGVEIDKIIGHYGTFENACRSGAISADILKKSMVELAGSTTDLSNITEELKMGSVGEEVKQVQEALVDLGFSLDKFGIDGIIGAETEAAIKAFQEAQGLEITGIVDESTLSALQEASKNTKFMIGDINRCINAIDELGGRELLIQGLSNVFNALKAVIAPITDAFREIFPATTSKQLYSLIEGFVAFTETLKPSDELLSNLHDTFAGIFSIVDIVWTVIKAVGKGVLGLIGRILGSSGGLLKMTASIGRFITEFRDALKAGNLVENFVNIVAAAFGKLIDFAKIPVDLIAGFIRGFEIGATPIITTIIDFASKILQTLCDILGIHSPSTETQEMGENLIEGLMLGIQEWGPKIWPKLKEFGVYLLGVFKDMFKSLFESLRTVNLEDVFSTIFSASSLVMMKQFLGSFTSFATSMKKIELVFEGAKMTMEGVKSMLTGIGSMFTGVGTMLTSFGQGFEAVSKGLASSFKANAWKKRGQAILSIALAIGVLAASLYVISKIEHSRLWESVGVIAAIAAILGVLSIAMGKFGSSGGLKAGVFVGLAASLLIIAMALQKVASIPAEDLGRAMITLGGVILGLTVVVTALGLFVKGDAMKYINNAGKMMIKLATALLMMMLVIKVASMLDADTVKRGMKVITKVGLLFIAFIAVSKIAGENAKKAGSMILKMSVAMLIMVGVIKLAAGLKLGEVLKGLAVVVAVGIVFAAIVAVSEVAGKEASKAGTMMLKMSVALVIAVLAIKMIAGIKVGDVIKGLAVITVIGLIFAGIVFLSSVAGQYSSKAGSMMLKMALGMLVIALAIKLLGTVSAGDMAKGLFAITMIGLVFSMILLVASIAGKTKGVMGTMIAMTVVIVLLTGVMVAISLMPGESLKKGVGALSALMISFALVFAAAKLIGDGKGLIKSLSSMLLMVGVLALIVALLSGINANDSIVKTMTALSELLLAMSASIVIISKVGKVSKRALGSMAAITGVVIALAAILGVMDHLGVQGSIQTATALGVLLNSMAASLLILDHVGSVSIKAIGAMALIGLIVVEIGAVLWLLKKMDIAPSIPTAVALGVLLIAMSASCLILGNVGPLAGQAILGAAALTVVIGIIGLFIAALGGLVDEFPQMETFLNKGIPIMEKIGQGIGKFIGGIFGGIGEGLVDSLPNISDKLTEFVNQFANINDGALDGAKSLVSVIGEIAALSVGTQIADIFTFGGTAMDEFQTNGVAFMNAMGAISTAASGVTVNKESITKITDAASELTGLQEHIAPIGGLASALKGRTDLKTFGKNAAGFISQMKTALNSLNEDFTYNKKALKAIIKAGKDLTGLQGTIEPIGGLASAFIANKSLNRFGKDVKKFINQMLIGLGSIPEDFTFNNSALRKIIRAGKDLAGLQSSVEPIGGLATVIKGRSDLGAFGKSIKKFINNVKTAIEGIPEDFVVPTCIGDLVSTATQLAGLQSSIEPIGGLVSAIKGKTDLGSWGTSIGEFVTGITNIKTLGDNGGITQETIDSIKNVSTMLTEVQNAIPTKGWLDGKVTLSDWGLEIDGFATAISDFSTKCTELNTDGIDTAISTAWRLQTLVATLQTIDMSGIEQFTGVGVGMAGADGAVSDIADAMVVFSTKVAGINVDAVDTSVTAATTLKDLINGLVGLDTSGIENFKVEDIGTAMENYNSYVSSLSIDEVNASVTAAHSLKRLISGLVGLDTSGVSIFISAVEDLCSMDVADFKVPDLSGLGSGIVTSITSGVTSSASTFTTAMSTIANTALTAISDTYNSFTTAGSNLGTMIVTGLNEVSAKIIIPIALMMGKAITAVRTKYANFKQAGEWLGDGLVQGMKNKEDDAYRAGYRLGQKAVEGEKAGQKSNSPSKLTEQAGEWLGEGLVIGMNNMVKSVYSTGKNLGKTAADSMTNTASRIAAAINTDIDTQPTIRPVLDLSEITAGANSIGTLLSGNTVGVNTNVSAINTMMNRRSQNGANADVVSAIGKLNDKLNKLGNTTYQVNGITYDDGSNISAAVKSLVHAAKVERRI